MTFAGFKPPSVVCVHDVSEFGFKLHLLDGSRLELRRGPDPGQPLEDF